MKLILSIFVLACGLTPATAAFAQVSGASGRATDARAVGINDRSVSEIFERDRIKQDERIRAKNLRAKNTDRPKHKSEKVEAR